VKPSAICGKGQCRREQTGKRPVEAIFRGVAALCRKIELRVVRQDRFVGNGWIIERKRAVKIAITGDAMGIRRLRPNQRCDNDHCDTD
jgi:hypothetical protein